jgi:hypothetical protein
MLFSETMMSNSIKTYRKVVATSILLSGATLIMYSGLTGYIHHPIHIPLEHAYNAGAIGAVMYVVGLCLYNPKRQYGWYNCLDEK